MSIIKFLISEFSDQEDIPIEVDDVLAVMRSIGVDDEVYFFDADIKTDILKGEIEHWEYPRSPTGPMRRVADIYTAKTLEPLEKRFIECKELLHVLDPKETRVDTFAKTDALIDKIVLPPDLVDSANEGIHASSDRVAVAYALAILFPFAVREQFLPGYRSGAISLEKIAEEVALPIIYVKFVMSEYWGDYYYSYITRRVRTSTCDRVTTLDASSNPMEVHSVPIGQNVFAYAKWLIEWNAKHGIQIDQCLIERSGIEMTMTSPQIFGRTRS